jgi:hypothetical protein
MSIHIRKLERYQINKLDAPQSQKNKNKAISNELDGKLLQIIRTEINETETKRKTYWINETESSFFENITKINKPLAKLTKRSYKELSSKEESRSRWSHCWILSDL